MEQLIKPQVIYKAKATTGEGSIWHPDRHTLFWVDIEGKTLYEFIPSRQDCRKWSFDRMVSTVVPENADSVVIALQDEIVRLNLDTGATTSIAPVSDGHGTLRCNDGKCDPEGRFWVGTIGMKNAPKGSAALYTVSLNGEVETKLTGVTNSNGLVWTADKKYMYYNDTPTGRIARYRYDAATGAIEWDGIAVRIPEGTGHPDGMTIDKNGNLWVAQWGGQGVYCYDPHTGELITRVEVPAPHVASCAFGGENLDLLFITTARAGLTEEQLTAFPDSGSLFCCQPGVTGVPANRITR